MLKDDIKPYIQGDGLVSVYVSQPANDWRNCDNGVLFTSQYILLLNILGQMAQEDKDNYAKVIAACVGKDGYLHRSPGDESLDEQDDHNGAYAAHIKLNIKPPFSLSKNLYRFPQLIALSAIASQNIFYRILATPLIWFTALVIATSCINVSTDDTDSRIGSWLVVKATEDHSLLCKLASLIWRARLFKDYKNGMQDVLKIYFGPEHPIAKYATKI